MSRCFLTLALVPAAYASLLEGDAPVTLDTAELSRIWQEVRSGKPAAPATAAGGAWQAAVMAEDEELRRVLLLAWLQEQNPLLPMAEHARDYAEAISLHIKALRGQVAACAVLALAYRTGRLGIFQLPPSEAKARWFEQRALTPENCPE